MCTELTPKLTATASEAQTVERWSKDSFLDKVNALRAQNLAGGHFLAHEIRFLFVFLSI